jgi:hypothetical protein
MTGNDHHTRSSRAGRLGTLHADHHLRVHRGPLGRRAGTTPASGGNLGTKPGTLRETARHQDAEVLRAMSNSRITWKISDFNGRFRAEMRVDGYPVSKSYHDTYTEAQQWCYAERDRLAQEVREYRQ